ncbi:MAG TPA: hypothetical protein DC024_11980 [Clostridiales bacterium]|jgi:DNA-directed RNA polymerase subunit RPC12/RpoP|nr:hypothetical protein [Clostridiales bacterium]HCS10401.1 hypothetical protein [Clostridiales bacterium]
MECPYCNKKMQLGAIEADNLLSWTPEGENKGRMGRIFRSDRSPNSVILAELNVFSGSTVKAYYCIDCKKIIIDVPVTEE